MTLYDYSVISEIDNSKPDPETIRKKRRIQLFRYYGGVSLFIACAVFGAVGYTLTFNLESARYDAVYDSLATQLKNCFTANLENKVNALNSLASFTGIYCSHPEQYPNCNMNIAWFDEFATSITTISEVASIGFLPIVKPDQIATFEADALAYTENDPDLVGKNLGVHDFGFGVFSYANLTYPDLQPYHDNTGKSEYSKYNYVAPLYLYKDMDQRHTQFLRNFHNIYNVAPTLDSVYECFQSHSIDCAVISVPALNGFFFQTPLDPSALIFKPVMPFYNESFMGGFAGVLFDLETLFDNNTVLSGASLDCVISVGDMVVTYQISKEQTVLKGVGDLHASKFNKYKKSYAITTVLDLPTTDGNPYILTIYPNNQFYAYYHQSAPALIAIGAIGIMIFTTILFAIYAYLVKNERIEHHLISENKHKFVRFISHQIRTPMHAVYMLLDLIDIQLRCIEEKIFSGVDEDRKKQQIIEFRKCHEDVSSSSETAIIVLNDLMKYDTIGTQTVNCDLKYFLIASLIDRTIRPMKVQGKQNGITITLQIDEELDSKHVYGDHFRLGQVIRNVISNALKFTAANSTILCTAVWKHDEQDLKMYPVRVSGYETVGYVRLSVKDQGPGLSPIQLSQLFTEGKQFNANQLQNGNGAGLGLWISQQIMDNHWGKIKCESEGIGTGCTFIIDIPIVERRRRSDAIQRLPSSEVDTTAHESASSANQSQSHEVTNLSSNSYNKSPSIEQIQFESHTSESSGYYIPKLPKVRNILIVDDTPSNRKVMRKKLELEKFSCYEAEDGQKAVQFMMSEAGQQIDLILMDFEMPVMNGPTATKILREKGFQTIILGVTGNVLQQDVLYFKECGANDVLFKPLHIETLYRAYYQIVSSDNNSSLNDSLHVN